MMELTLRDKEKLRGIIAATSKHRDDIIEMALVERDKMAKEVLGSAIDQLDDAMGNLKTVVNLIRL